MRIATGVIETWRHEDWNRGPSTEYCITSIAEDLAMSPAELATLTANGAIVLPDLADGLIVQLDYEPEDYDASEWYNVADGTVTRGWSSPRIFSGGGAVQL